MIIRTDTKPVRRHVPKPVRSAVAKRLILLRSAGVPLYSEIKGHARQHGVNEGTVYRWIEQEEARQAGRCGRKPVDIITEDVMIVFARFAGRVRPTWQECTRRKLIPKMSERSFYRHIDEEVDRMIRRGLGMSDQEAALLGLYLRFAVPHRNEQWQIDTFEVPLDLDDGGREPVKVRITPAIDDHSRLLVGYAMSIGAANGTVITHALRDAMAVRTVAYADLDGQDTETEIGGVPWTIRHDNAVENLGQQTVALLLDVDTVAMPVPPRDPTSKGKIERFAWTAQEWAVQFPGWIGGPEDRFQKEYYRPRGRNGLFTVEQFELMWADWVAFYNFERPHRSLGGLRPIDVWVADADTELRRVPDEVLERHVLIERPKPLKVSRDGVNFRKRTYVHPDLFGVEQVSVRYSEIDDTFVDCWDDQRFLCRAVPVEMLTDDQVDTVLGARQDYLDELKGLRRQGVAARKEAAAVTAAELDERIPAPQPDDVEAPSDGDVARHPAARPASKVGKRRTTRTAVPADGDVEPTSARAAAEAEAVAKFRKQGDRLRRHTTGDEADGAA